MSIVLSLEEEAIRQSEVQQNIIEASNAADVDYRVEGIAQGVADVDEIIAGAPTIDGAEFELVGIIGDMAIVGTDLDPNVLLPVSKGEVANEGLVEAIKTLFHKRDHIQDRLREMKTTKNNDSFFRGLAKQAEVDMRSTYDNPNWVEANLPDVSRMVTVRLMNTANVNGKQLTTPEDVLKAVEVVFKVVIDIAAHEKPFIEKRQKLVKEIADKGDPAYADQLWEANEKDLLETAANRFLKRNKRNYPMIGHDVSRSKEWPVAFNHKGDFGFSVYFALYKTDGTFQAPSKQNAKHYTEVLRKLLEMKSKLDEIHDKDTIPYWDSLNVAYDDLKYGDNITTYISSSQTVNEVAELAEGVSSEIERLIGGLYVVMFDKHQSQ